MEGVQSISASTEEQTASMAELAHNMHALSELARELNETIGSFNR
ncbi:methyl-accepting chemotaxis protein [Heliomicrobium modesticaldum Ice1]|uniref:Methyl-accepting chemotaxis protein n=1 Tax=Heliobacterium modesticaldum (strain ATCC 51547 / Ice1) TaxID=498761 RepID=B0TCS5_HELMI|nr:hypothetical protein [Heliomicrobium modesticaldum]ABZ84101.1 methyl-accepting chemotaxis protein [Heliomicrobium modesticaldum Ice1]